MVTLHCDSVTVLVCYTEQCHSRKRDRAGPVVYKSCLLLFPPIISVYFQSLITKSASGDKKTDNNYVIQSSDPDTIISHC